MYFWHLITVKKKMLKSYLREVLARRHWETYKRMSIAAQLK